MSQISYISAALFPSPSTVPSQGPSGAGSANPGGTPQPQQQPSKAGIGSGDPQGSGQKLTDDLPIERGGPTSPSSGNPQDQYTTPEQQTPQSGNPPSNSGGILSPGSNAGSAETKSSGNNGEKPNAEGIPNGSNAKGSSDEPPFPQGGNEPSVDTGKPGAQKGDTNVGGNPEMAPTTFAFVSNQSPPTAGDQTMARAPDGAAMIGTATIQPGQNQIVHGTPVSVAQSAIVVASSTFAFDPPQNAATPAAVPVITQGSNGGLVVGSKTILPGHKDTVNDHEVSVGSSNVIIDGKSYAFPAVTPPPSVDTGVNIGGVQIGHGFSNAMVVGGSTYSPGALVTISGHAVSVGSGIVAVGGTTHNFPTALPILPLLVDGHIVQKNANGHVMLGTSTLEPGSRATLAGHIVSLGADNNNVVVDHSTYALPKTAGVVQASSPPIEPDTSPLMIDGYTILKDAMGQIIIGTSTILPGTQVTMGDHVVSAANSNEIIMDHRTYSLPDNTAGIVSTPAAPITLLTEWCSRLALRQSPYQEKPSPCSQTEKNS